MNREKGYAPIAAYGFLSDCRSAALVAPDGAIDWLCWPRFDSPSIFAAILDAKRGGSFTIAPTGRWTSSRSYVEGTNILKTVFRTSTGVVQLSDWLHTGARQALCRLLECLEGEVEMEIICDPRPDYGRVSIVVWEDLLGWKRTGLPDGETLVLDGAEPKERLLLRHGENKGVTLGLNRPGPSDLFAARDRAEHFWQDWSEDIALPLLSSNEVQQKVLRSALALKGLQYSPTGAFVAAATASLPEKIGGTRNWDYRYSWLRDSSFTLYALRAVGKQEEAQSWFDFLLTCALRQGTMDSLQTLYDITGESLVDEHVLDHLDGYKNSRPVRVGQGATKQTQHDIYGELLDSIWLLRLGTPSPLGPHRRALVNALAEQAISGWRNPDEGIWEVRGGAKHFVYSKVMCWVALDRAINLAQKDGFEAPIGYWRKERDLIKEDVLTMGYDKQLGAFTQSYGSGTLDASALLFAQVGFISPKHPHFVSTVRAVQHGLMRGGLVDRYHTDEISDVLGGEDEATFAICSLWLVMALAQIGAIEEAQELFSHVLSFGNDLDLFAEELTPEGEQVGNFPQGYTHIAIITCAFTLERCVIKRAQAQDEPLRALAGWDIP